MYSQRDNQALFVNRQNLINGQLGPNYAELDKPAGQDAIAAAAAMAAAAAATGE